MMEMLSSQVLANRRFDFSTTASKGTGSAYAFQVVEMEGFEALSQPFRFTLTLVSDDASVDFDAMLAHPATFTIHGPDGDTSTPYHGILAEFEQMHHADDYVFYRAVLVPRVWNLSLSRISEVYLDEQTIADTLKTVLKNGGLTTNDFEFRLTGTYRTRSFVCQFEETYLEFLSRWMEHEGMYFCFDHASGQDKLVVVDDTLMLDKSASALLPLVYRPDDRMNIGLARDAVRNFMLRAKPLPKEVLLQDFNHRKAAVALKATATVSEQGRGQVMIYGENFRDETEGARYATLRAQEIFCAGRVYSGEGTAVGLRAGAFMKLAGHYRDDFNAEYLLTEIHHRGSQAGALLTGARGAEGDAGAGGETTYSNSFRAIASNVQFRAERVTLKPRIPGTMTATIDAESDDPTYADLDEFGQYKVQLPFDLTDKNPNKGSARVRMASPYAGSGYGMDFPLLKGAEVLLSFTDGDPDQPVITNAVPNSANKSVVTSENAAENLIRTAGDNVVSIDDTRGKQSITLESPYQESRMTVGYSAASSGFFVATKGSSQSMTAGVDNSLTVGAKNDISLSVNSSLAAGVTSDYTIGIATSFAASAEVSWKLGRSIELDDCAESVSLKKTVTEKASDKVKFQGGLAPIYTTLIDKTKTRVKAAVLATLAANSAIAASVATKLLKTNGDGETEYGSDENRDAALVDSLGSAAVDVLVQALMQHYASGVAETLEKATNTHASTMEMDRNGIVMKVSKPGAASPAPVVNALGFAVEVDAVAADTSVSQIKHTWATSATGELAMTETSSVLSFEKTGGGKGTVTLSTAGAKIESPQAVQAVSGNASVKVEPTQLTLATDPAKKVSVAISEDSVKTTAGEATLLVSNDKIRIALPGGTSGLGFKSDQAVFAFQNQSGLKCTPAGVKLYAGGKPVQLG
ncbi:MULTISPECIES: type VI secretion system Vgr family protein [unclassified Caballeronia]|uniref:type VI secretion system Vgr family protein n=1 Tax=unclassified Caballeronia TaxID=2646786 RepID=UPI002027F186|nr:MULTISPECIES: type VI secretion system tip protein TssI/VgrG [unclassified Caballeronia]